LDSPRPIIPPLPVPPPGWLIVPPDKDFHWPDLISLSERPAPARFVNPRRKSTRPYAPLDEIIGFPNRAPYDHFGDPFARAFKDPIIEMQMIATAIQRIVSAGGESIPRIDEAAPVAPGESTEPPSCPVAPPMAERRSMPRIHVREVVNLPVRCPRRARIPQHVFLRKLTDDDDLRLKCLLDVFGRISTRRRRLGWPALHLPQRRRQYRGSVVDEFLKDIMRTVLMIQDSELRYYCELLSIEMDPEILPDSESVLSEL
jgi:hypothetical protein